MDDLQKEINLLKEKKEFETEKPKPKVANWKTYRNEKNGFEFKYPEEYDLYEDCKLKEEGDMMRLGDNFLIEVVNSGGLSLDEYILKFISELQEAGLLREYTIIRRLLVSGRKRLKFPIPMALGTVKLLSIAAYPVIL